ncbi:hypothetical protein DF186_14705, partial [Enterococcus hirae]
PKTTLYSTPFIYTPNTITIIYTSLTTSKQINLKKIITYSSITHINLITINIFNQTTTIKSPIFNYKHTKQNQPLHKHNIY